MASLEKKRKAKNSYIHNGGEKNDGTTKIKRICYYTKAQRMNIKRNTALELNER